MSNYRRDQYPIFRVICAEELMRVMVRLGNPRTMEEIKVQTVTNCVIIDSYDYFMVAGDDCRGGQ